MAWIRRWAGFASNSNAIHLLGAPKWYSIVRSFWGGSEISLLRRLSEVGLEEFVDSCLVGQHGLGA